MQAPSPSERPPVSTCHDLSEGHDPSLVQPPIRPGLMACLGRFHILQELGAGGMGVVLLAMDSSVESSTNPSGAPQEPIAIKILRPELARHPRAVKRFLAEARHLQQFNHPHIVRVLEIVVVDGRPCLVMPYFPEGSLARRLRRQGRPSPAEALRICRQLSDALAHAHSKGIIHRDLNPANVLLDRHGNVCLTDFGLARTVFNDSIDRLDAEHHEGTLPYMSPAVAQGEAEDTRCDIYGLGALLYELLTGRPPYQGRDLAEIRRAILAGPPVSVLELNPYAPASLVRVVEWAMARERHRRYADMRDVAADLQRVSEGLDPLGPHARTGPAALRRLVGRLLAVPHPTPLTVAGAAAVALLSTGFLLSRPSRASAEINPTSIPVPPVDATANLGPEWLFYVDGTRLIVLPRSPATEPSVPLGLVGSDRDIPAGVPAGELRSVRVVKWFDLSLLSPRAIPPNHPPPHVHAQLVADSQDQTRLRLLVSVSLDGAASRRQLGCYDFHDARLLWYRDEAQTGPEPTLPRHNPSPHDPGEVATASR